MLSGVLEFLVVAAVIEAMEQQARAQEEGHCKAHASKPARGRCYFLLCYFALLTVPSVASAQGPATPPPAVPFGVMTAQTVGPTFQSGGIKVTVTSIAAKNRNVSLALSLENVSKENLFLAVIGPPLGVNGGAAFSPEAIGGVAYCIYNPRNAAVLGLERSEQIAGCLRGDKPQLTPDTFTLIEAGNSAPMNVAFVSAGPADLDKDFSFSMNVAVFKEADLGSPDDGAKGKPPPLPKSLRYVSVGIAPLPLKEK
jgi:hypothetical protein